MDGRLFYKHSSMSDMSAGHCPVATEKCKKNMYVKCSCIC